MAKSRTNDIVLWGANGFVGKILAEYLWPRYGQTGAVRFALGGNDLAELEALRDRLGGDDRLSLIVGDAFDDDFLRTMTRNARVVVSTVGPYARLGSPLVAACVENGTDYCDLTGETQWMRRMIDTHQKAAEASGARIVHACGFDSIPSDLGVFHLQEEARARFGHPVQRVKMRIRNMRGGISGGTVASMLNVIEEARRDPEVARILRNPYALAPEGMRTGIRQPGVGSFAYDDDTGCWVAPFVMAAVNTRVVHRSNALMGYPWGKDFRYDEAVMMDRGITGRLRAAAYSGVLGAFVLAGAFPATRSLLEKTVLPKPGQGPSARQREKGFYRLYFIGTDPDGTRLRTVVTGDRDPGYGSTPKMLGESAVCLLREIGRTELHGGFWTPASAMGGKLIQRLTANAGLTFDFVAEAN